MQFTIYHTNDIHADYAVLKKLHTYLAHHKGPQDLFLDSGDFTDLKDVIVQADMGTTAVTLLMNAGLDAMTLGNGEEDVGNEGISAMIAAGAPVICTNVTDNNGIGIPGVSTSRVFERGGKRILVLGAAPYYNQDLVPNGYNVFTTMNNLLTQEPFAWIRAELERQQGTYDYCILLSHGGIDAERKMLSQIPEIDLCLGGHSHTVLAEGNYNQCGKGEFLGKIVIEIDDDDESAMQSDSKSAQNAGSGIRLLSNELVELPDVEESDAAGAVFDALLAEKQAFADQILARELPVVEELELDYFSESPLINFICDCLLDHCGGDLAIMHAGIAEGPLVRPVSRKSLIETFPSKLNPTTFTVTGQQILDAVALSFNADHIHQDGRGPGFRGHILGTLGFSSNVRIVPGAPFTMTINGAPVDPSATYRLVSDDYLQRGSGYPSLKVPNDQAQFDPWFIRDLVQHYLTAEKLFAQAAVRRQQ